MITDFPQYRKYKNNKAYFKISSKDEFEEIRIEVGKKIVKNHQAKILPDRNLIADMLNDYELYWDKISVEEYEAFRNS